jgi:hypothetical protein
MAKMVSENHLPLPNFYMISIYVFTHGPTLDKGPRSKVQ